MSITVVTAPDQKPVAVRISIWRRFLHQKVELESQLLRGCSQPGKGLTFEQFKAFLEHQNPFERAQTPAEAQPKSPTLKAISISQQDELQRQIVLGFENQGEGLTLKQLQAFLEHRNPFEEIVAVHQSALFATPEEQIQTILRINKEVWKNPAITAKAIKALGNPPKCPPSDENHLYCVCLFFETGSPVKTFKLNWQACIYVHGKKGTWKWDGLVFSPKGVRQRIGAKPRPIGLCWRVCELGRQFKGQSVKKVRSQLDQVQIMGIGQELSFVAALHPKWVMSMNGENMPFVDAPDLEVVPCGRGVFCGAPYLGFGADSRQVDLYARDVGDRHGRFGSGSLW